MDEEGARRHHQGKGRVRGREGSLPLKSSISVSSDGVGVTRGLHTLRGHVCGDQGCDVGFGGPSTDPRCGYQYFGLKRGE